MFSLQSRVSIDEKFSLCLFVGTVHKAYRLIDTKQTENLCRLNTKFVRRCVGFNGND